jgi:hypothetical protein
VMQPVWGGDTRNLEFKSRIMTAQDTAPSNDMVSTLLGAQQNAIYSQSHIDRNVSLHRQYRFHTG